MSDIEVHIHRTNKRLQVICAQLNSASIVEFGEAAVELLYWCEDARAFRTEFEESLLHCLETIQQACLQPGFDLDLGFRVISTCFRHRDLLSKANVTRVTQWCEKLGRLVQQNQAAKHASRTSTTTNGQLSRQIGVNCAGANLQFMSSTRITSSLASPLPQQYTNDNKNLQHIHVPPTTRLSNRQQEQVIQQSVNLSGCVEQSQFGLRPRAGSHFISTSYPQRHAPYPVPCINMMHKNINSGVIATETNQLNGEDRNQLLVRQVIGQEHCYRLNTGTKNMLETIPVPMQRASPGSYYLNIPYGQSIAAVSKQVGVSSGLSTNYRSFPLDVQTAHSDPSQTYHKPPTPPSSVLPVGYLSSCEELGSSSHHSVVNPYDDTQQPRMNINVRDGTLLIPFRIEHSLAVSNHAFYLKDTVYNALMAHPDMELQFKAFHQHDPNMNCNWPPCVSVTVNNHPLTLDRSVSGSQPHNALFIKLLCHPGKNSIQISVTACCCSHLFMLQLIHCPFVRSVVHDLWRKRKLPAHHCISKIKRVILSKKEPVTIRLSLKCPISLKRITFPTRGRDCQHVQCFDLESYLQINAVYNSWLCPFCSKHAALEGLEIDEYIFGILETADVTIEEVIIDSSSRWSSAPLSESNFHDILPKSEINLEVTTKDAYSLIQDDKKQICIASKVASVTKSSKIAVFNVNANITCSSGPPSAPPLISEGTLVTTFQRQRPASAAPSTVIDLLSPKLVGAVSNDNLSDFTLASLESADLSDIGSTDLVNLTDLNSLGDSEELLSFL